ncbi:MAG: UDP-N-acetylenolpyruvoylglucosamine reductase, partial [Lachnospiraceae bacterium]|nr:UDP-N-acetylenolpyruvoylglucosamine reductase [Lachnospiraceae bacterium]
GFVINKGGATASDIYNLCKEVEKRVKAEFGVSLEMEVKLLGEFEEE